ncbi:hypothetical protein [Microbulbifer sp. PSTR4-B]|uniref:hypothetical protein n=1 Tax=unclassified Microbulbifer TaxID=2619833 RepID=UPI00403A8EE8
MSNLVLMALVGGVLLLQLVLVGALLWHRFGTKLLLVNYSMSGGEGEGAWVVSCSSFGRVRGPLTDAKLDFLLDTFISAKRRDFPDLTGWSLNGVTVLDAAAPLPKEE